MYRTTRRYATAFAISAALLVAGCSSGEEMAPTAADAEGEVFLQPVAAPGPDPFTQSTSEVTETPPPVTRTPQPVQTGPTPTEQGVRAVSGDTPGLYGGTRDKASCDVEAQIRFLGANRGKQQAFADTVGVAANEVPGYLRGLTAVQLRGDTRVTNHGFRDGRADSYQSVLQAGTAVLVDNRGMPRVRCSCGNPLTPPAPLKSDPTVRGKPWSGYRPSKVVVVTPAPVVITNITIINITNNTWIERPTGHKSEDKVVPRPKPSPTSPAPTSPSPTSPSPTSPSPSSPSPSESCPAEPPPVDENGREPELPPGCPTPTPDDCPTVQPPPDPDGRDFTPPPGCPTPPTPPEPESQTDEPQSEEPTEPGPEPEPEPDENAVPPSEAPDGGADTFNS
ncbi:DUF6777 domain-containing protein [Streptomyces cavernicola]|uniref:DUF6777 domain-containing protein n=1 Tax=Streptomyces cavernicola TaxID=3043613 RepID=A0ABT6S732_9ACTN|nr:DUF6777 domain-containing protein [Streptomyces sp. B-S-A6]MDI3403907.1 hypothetical protein [Streptomyces sp. B-S-A6]